MKFDGSSPATCKAAALLLAGVIHLFAFNLVDLDSWMPSVPQPAVTRLLLLPPIPVVAPVEVEPVETPPTPEPTPSEPATIAQKEPSPVQIPEEKPKVAPQPIEKAVEERPPEEIAEETPQPPQKPEQEPEPAAPRPAEVPELPQPAALEASEDSDGIFDVPPAVFGRIKPEYPLSARQAKIEGNAVCELLVSKRGRVLEVSIIDGSGHDDIDAAAVKALRLARFSPATKRGRPVEAHVRLVVEFKLSSD